MAQLNIGIAGAGIGGLATAAALARDGHSVTVFDQFDAPRPIGSGLVIQPVGQGVLARIGALDTALGYGTRITHMRGHEVQRGRRVLDVSYDRKGEGRRFGLAIHRASLFTAVYGAALMAGVSVVPSHQVIRAAAGVLEFANGTRSEAFDLVIDATGAGSPLSPLKARTLPYGAVWATVNWPDDASFPRFHLSQRYRGAQNMLGVMPIGRLPGDDRFKAALFWSLPQDEYGAFLSRTIEDWKAEATQLWPEFAPYLQGIIDHADLTPAFYSHGTLRRPWGDKIIHIGDAAHRASPQLGQGANMALLDGYALTLALRSGLEGAGARMWKARRWHLSVYQWMSAAFTPMYQSSSVALPAIRDHLLAPLSRLGLSQTVLSRLVCGDLLVPLGRLQSEANMDKLPR